jgi:drug/metabolite transporter (DMT)-like permease
MSRFLPEILLLLVAVIEGAYPIVVKQSTALFPPLFSLGVSTLVASMALFIYMKLRSIRIADLRPKIVEASFGTIIYIVAFGLVFIGSQFTSGLNTALLLQAEVLFTVLVHGLIFRERLSAMAYAGSFILLLGAFAIVYRPGLDFLPGDLIILSAVVMFPFVNYFHKQVISTTPVSSYLFYRTLLGGSVFLIASFFFEDTTSSWIDMLTVGIWHFLFLGLIVFSFQKLLFLQALKFLKVSTAISLVTTRIGFSLLFAYYLLHDLPTSLQWYGVFFLVVGSLFVSYQKPKLATEGL